jgi:hypothetical protein
VAEPTERDIGQDDRQEEQQRVLERHRRPDDDEDEDREGRERTVLEEPLGQPVDDSASLDHVARRFLRAQGMHYSGVGSWGTKELDWRRRRESYVGSDRARE